MAEGDNSEEILQNPNKLQSYLSESLKNNSLLSVESSKEGVYRLSFSVTPEDHEIIKEKFAGNIKELDEDAGPVVRKVKSSSESLIGRYRERAEEESKLSSYTRRYNLQVDALEAAKADAKLHKKIENLKTRMTLEGANEKEIEAAAAEVTYRDRLTPMFLDIRRRRRVDEEEAQRLYRRSASEYRKSGAYGSAIDALIDFSIKGFEHEVQDPEIKEYFDSYAKDVKLVSFIQNIFHSIWLNGACHIVTSESKYKPHSDGISSIPGKPPSKIAKSRSKKEMEALERGKKGLESFLKEKFGEKSYAEIASDLNEAIQEVALRKMITDVPTTVPTDFSLIDPSLVNVNDSLMFEDKQRIVLKAEALEEVRNLLERQSSGDPEDKLTEREQQLLKLLPSKMKQAAVNNDPYVLEDKLTYNIFYRKLNYERRSKPPLSRVFDDLDYKEELRKADFATLDGIVNYILLVTVGDDKSPVTDPAQLKAIADAIDTPSKAYHIVWTHAIDMKYVTPDRVGEILGEEKYKPVNSDIFLSLGVPRAIIDGTEVSQFGAKLAVVATNAKISSVRMLVEDWIYDIYKRVSAAAGFDHYPKIRWASETISLDSLATKRTNISNLIAQKHISWESGVNDLGFDPESELSKLKEQLPLEEEGILFPGSAFQSTEKKEGTSPGNSGRPTGQIPSGEKAPPSDKRSNKRSPNSTSPSQEDRGSVNVDLECKIDKILSFMELVVGAISQPKSETDPQD